METPLAPSLWRTCRVLANRRRLRLFQTMLDQEPQTVGVLAERCGMSLPHCSQYLRMLQARGLCRAIRDSRWVRYELHADSSVKDSVPILYALIGDLSIGNQNIDAIFSLATACTHPRRIKLLAILCRYSPISLEALRVRSGISKPAFFRHLKKLLSRKFVRCDDDVVALTPPPGAFAVALLAAASNSDSE